VRTSRHHLRPQRRRPDERDYLRELFIRMLLHSEERGPHASGLAWLKTDGSHRIFKRPMRAHELVYEKPFHELLGQVDNETTVLMGHTRTVAVSRFTSRRMTS